MCGFLFKFRDQVLFGPSVVKIRDVGACVTVEASMGAACVRVKGQLFLARAELRFPGVERGD